LPFTFLVPKVENDDEDVVSQSFKRTRGINWQGSRESSHEQHPTSLRQPKIFIMRVSLLFVTLAVPTTLAFPWLRPDGIEALFNHPEAKAEIRRRLQERSAAQEEPRQLGTGLVPGVVDLLGGTVKATLDPILGLIPTSGSVKGLKRFPEGMCYNSTVTISSD
jgi:hypothetical protein